ncbi:hypothetical protein GCK32_008838 [Trichostrongylus colubriformis]|uniref:Uncharacterized protein n=1 Tax=Trichostrongylus colubriformis TaxID=6319 RepID=A0AAN8G3F3_TRICO
MKIVFVTFLLIFDVDAYARNQDPTTVKQAPTTTTTTTRIDAGKQGSHSPSNINPCSNNALHITIKKPRVVPSDVDPEIYMLILAKETLKSMTSSDKYKDVLEQIEFLMGLPRGKWNLFDLVHILREFTTAVEQVATCGTEEDKRKALDVLKFLLNAFAHRGGPDNALLEGYAKDLRINEEGFQRIPVLIKLLIRYVQRRGVI